MDVRRIGSCMHTGENLSDGLGMTRRVDLRNYANSSQTSIFDDVLHVFLSVDLFRMVGRLSEIREHFHLIWPRLIVDEMPMEDVELRVRHSILEHEGIQLQSAHTHQVKNPQLAMKIWRIKHCTHQILLQNLHRLVMTRRVQQNSSEAEARPIFDGRRVDEVLSRGNISGLITGWLSP